MTPIFYKDKQTETDKEILALVREIQAKQRVFENKTDKLIRRIDRALEMERHMQQVTESQIDADIAQGIKNINGAAEGIVFPEDVT